MVWGVGMGGISCDPFVIQNRRGPARYCTVTVSVCSVRKESAAAGCRLTKKASTSHIKPSRVKRGARTPSPRKTSTTCRWIRTSSVRTSAQTGRKSNTTVRNGTSEVRRVSTTCGRYRPGRGALMARPAGLARAGAA